MAKKDAVNMNDHLPQAEEEMNGMSIKSLDVAYHTGPTEINFFGIAWQRDVSQTVTDEQWSAMQARADFNEFNFTQE